MLEEKTKVRCCRQFADFYVKMRTSYVQLTFGLDLFAADEY